MCVCVSHPVLLDGGAVVSQGDLGGGGAELWQAEDGQVLVVQAVVLHDQPLHLLHHRQHPGQAVIGTVSWRGHKARFIFKGRRIFVITTTRTSLCDRKNTYQSFLIN